MFWNSLSPIQKTLPVMGFQATQRLRSTSGIAGTVAFMQHTASCNVGGTTRRPSIAVMIGLERSLSRHSDVAGLLVAELRQLHAKLLEVESRNLLVEMLGQDIDVVLVLVRTCPQLDLREHLVREG